MFKTRKRRIKEECWNLDIELVKWLNEHLAVFLEDSRKFVDLTFHKYKYKGKEYTLEECVEMLIEDTWFMLNDDLYTAVVTKELEFHKKRMFDLLNLTFWQLWW